jgi:hypothetical protein
MIDEATRPRLYIKSRLSEESRPASCVCSNFVEIAILADPSVAAALIEKAGRRPEGTPLNEKCRDSRWNAGTIPFGVQSAGTSAGSGTIPGAPEVRRFTERALPGAPG